MSTELATSHSLPLLGFKPDRRHVVNVTARNAAGTFHHDIQEMPSGRLLVLSTEVRRIEDYPTVVDDDAAATWSAMSSWSLLATAVL